MVRSRDIAAVVGVSRQAVSAVLNGKEFFSKDNQQSQRNQ